MALWESPQELLAAIELGSFRGQRRPEGSRRGAPSLAITAHTKLIFLVTRKECRTRAIAVRRQCTGGHSRGGAEVGAGAASQTFRQFERPRQAEPNSPDAPTPFSTWRL